MIGLDMGIGSIKKFLLANLGGHKVREVFEKLCRQEQEGRRRILINHFLHKICQSDLIKIPDENRKQQSKSIKSPTRPSCLVYSLDVASWRIGWHGIGVRSRLLTLAAPQRRGRQKTHSATTPPKNDNDRVGPNYHNKYH
eukprot:scaffold212_cov173-Amphora_coffeaeformis.AAC.4